MLVTKDYSESFTKYRRQLSKDLWTIFFLILGAIKMERSEHERAKYPDRINLDRKGLHSKLSSIIKNLKENNLENFKNAAVNNYFLRFFVFRCAHLGRRT